MGGHIKKATVLCLSIRTLLTLGAYAALRLYTVGKPFGGAVRWVFAVQAASLAAAEAAVGLIRRTGYLKLPAPDIACAYVLSFFWSYVFWLILRFASVERFDAGFYFLPAVSQGAVCFISALCYLAAGLSARRRKRGRLLIGAGIGGAPPDKKGKAA